MALVRSKHPPDWNAEFQPAKENRQCLSSSLEIENSSKLTIFVQELHQMSSGDSFKTLFEKFSKKKYFSDETLFTLVVVEGAIST